MFEKLKRKRQEKRKSEIKAAAESDIFDKKTIKKILRTIRYYRENRYDADLSNDERFINEVLLKVVNEHKMWEIYSKWDKSNLVLEDIFLWYLMADSYVSSEKMINDGLEWVKGEMMMKILDCANDLINKETFFAQCGFSYKNAFYTEPSCALLVYFYKNDKIKEIYKILREEFAGSYNFFVEWRELWEEYKNFDFNKGFKTALEWVKEYVDKDKDL